MANRNRVPPFEEDGPRSPPPAARPVPRICPPGSLGTAAHPQHHRHRIRPRRRIRRHRPRPHPVHRRARPHPLPRRCRDPLPALRAPPRQPAGQPEHRDPRPAPPPSGPPANIRENRSRTTNQAHRRSHLHHRHHKIESPEMGHNSGNLRAVGCRLIVNSLSSTPSSAQLLDRGFFRALEPGSYFITYVRPHTFDVKALLEELDDGILAGAAIDCDPQTPFDTANAYYRTLAAHEKVLATPHVAFATTQAERQSLDTVVENVEAFANGQPRNVLVKR